MKRFHWLMMLLVLLALAMLLSGCVSKSKYEDLQAERDAALSQLATLQAGYDALVAVYPPRDFSSVEELENWLLENDVSEQPPPDIFDVEQMYSRALQIQADALKDGYIVSVDIDVISFDLAYIACVAIIDGDFWWWYPETDELSQYTGLGKVTRE